MVVFAEREHNGRIFIEVAHCDPSFFVMGPAAL
jgi:hypothetical protein